MDVPALSTFLSPPLTVASVRNTGETGDIHRNEEVKKGMIKGWWFFTLDVLEPFLNEIAQNSTPLLCISISECIFWDDESF